MICVKCGGEGTKGSMRHPYCEDCFKLVWDNDQGKFMEWLEATHGG